MWLPFITVFDQLLLVIEQLFVQESRVLKVRSFNNGVYWASLLAETTEDALGHVDIILGRAARAVWSGLSLDSDGEGRASGLAELASYAPLLSGWVASEGMLTTEHRTQGTFLPRIMNDVLNKL